SAYCSEQGILENDGVEVAIGPGDQHGQHHTTSSGLGGRGNASVDTAQDATDQGQQRQQLQADAQFSCQWHGGDRFANLALLVTHQQCPANDVGHEQAKQQQAR